MTFNKVTMFKSYFLVMKLLTIISVLVIFKLQFTDFHWSSLIFSSASLMFAVIQFFALIKAEQLIEERSYLGIVIGLVIAVMSLASIMLPFGLWGLYSLLNREFMSQYCPTDAPDWFEENIIQSKIVKF